MLYAIYELIISLKKLKKEITTDLTSHMTHIQIIHLTECQLSTTGCK